MNEEVKQAWLVIKEYMLGDKQPFVPSQEIATLDRYLEKALAKDRESCERP